MSRISLWLRRPLGVVLCTVLIAGQGFAAPLPGDASDPLETLVQPYLQPDGPGCALALSREGQRVVEHAFGLANLEHRIPNTPGTVFEAASASKQMTAAAVLLLAKEGKLALEDDVRRYLPELPDYGDTITIDHLLTHRSGMRDWRYLLGVAGSPLGTRVHSNADALELASWQRGLNHQPGNEYAYTNTGFTLAAIIVERVSGVSFAEFSRKRLFEPLGMDSTQWRDNHRRVVSARATAYSRAGGGWTADMPFENAHGAGGLLTTVGDLLTWNEALHNGRLGAGLGVKLQQAPLLANGQPSPYARGLFLSRHRGTDEIGHGGVTGGYVAWTGRYPEHGIAVAVLCNGAVNPAQLARALVEIHLPASALALPPNTAGPPMSSASAAPALTQEPRWRPDAAALQEVAGDYGSEELRTSFTARVERGSLVLSPKVVSGQEWVLSPTIRDMFVFPYGNVRVVREAGEPCALLLNLDRLRDFTLVKTGCQLKTQRSSM